MSEKPVAYTAEVAARLRELVFSLEPDLRDMESAARTVLGLSHAAKAENVDIPEDLIAEGIHFVSGQAADLAGELSGRYYELFALVVHGRLPEEDECCLKRKAKRERPNLSLRLAPEAGA